jgi:peptidoglycan/LPS O-acetylase OafA/YrhL
MEFRSSLVLYLTQLGLARLKSNLRVLSLIALIIWCHAKDRWEMILFYSGFLLAEFDFRRQAVAAARSVLPTASLSQPSTTRRQRLWTALYLAVFMIGIYLGGQPQHHLEHAPGWATLYAWIPSYAEHKQRYWVGWAAVLLVWSTSNSPLLQRLFTNGPVQYLGQISFSLYLMHGPVTHTIGYASMDFFWRLIGENTVMRKEIGFCISAVIDIASAIWAADIFMRVIDTPTVKLAKWMEEKSIVALE